MDGNQDMQRGTRSGDRTGVPGVESALGRDRTQSGELPPDMGTNRISGNTGGGSSVLDDAPVAVRKAADQARGAMGDAVEVAQEQISRRLEDQIDMVTERLEAVHTAVMRVGEQLRNENQAGLARITDQAASRVERAATYLRGNDLDRIVSDTERFATRRPEMFLGGAFALGLLAARFLKSTAPTPPRSGYGSGYRPALPPAGGSSAYGYRPGMYAQQQAQAPYGSGYPRASQPATSPRPSTGTAGVSPTGYSTGGSASNVAV